MEPERDSQLQLVLPHLRVVRGPDGEGRYTAWCPFHPDGQGDPPHRPNLQVSAKGYICFACGEKGPLKKLAQHLSIPVPTDREVTAARGGDQDALTYSYRDGGGEVLFQVVRVPGKRFFQRRPDSRGGWANNLQGVRRVLYRLPELLARPDDTVFVVEGEKDAEALASLGLLATTNPGGAGKWRDEYNDALVDREVAILPDNDEPGRQHAETVARALSGVAREVKVVGLPDLPEKGDVSDWLAGGHTADELRALAASAPAREGGEPDNDEDEELPALDKRLANRVVRHVLSSTKAYLFHDQRGEAYAALPMQGGRRILRLRGKEFQGWLALQAVMGLRQACGGETLNAATTALAGIAVYRRPEHPLHVRCARADDALWLDLDGQRAVGITPAGWEIAPEPPILFRSFPHQGALPDPVPGGDIRKVLGFVNLDNDDDQLLLLCYLVAAMVPDVPIAVLVLHGVHGSAKTSLMKIVKRLLDPSRPEVRGGIRDQSEFALAAWQTRVLFFDNMKTVPDWLSDALCRTVTGEGWSKRTLYTDEDSTVFDYQRVVGLNGINLVTNRPDLLDRALILQLQPVTVDQRMDEETLWAEFDKVRPSILGGVLDALAAAMRLLPKLDLPRLPRLADFARWCAAAAEVLGFGAGAFLDAFDRNVGRQHQAAVEASPVAQAIVALMESRGRWEGTPAELLLDLNNAAEASGIDTHSRYWPRDPNWVTRRIHDVQPDLAAMGIEFHETRSGLQRTVVLQKSSAKAVTADTAVTGPVAGDAQGGDSDGSDGSSGTSGPPGQLPYKADGDEAKF